MTKQPHSSVLKKLNILRLVEHGFYSEALCRYSKYNSASRTRSRFTFPPLLKACGKLGLHFYGKSLHSQLIKTGFLSEFSTTALIGMYMNLTLISDALKVFEEMPDRSLPSLNVVVSGLAQNGHLREALSMFASEGNGDLRPNSVTLASFLSMCTCVSFSDSIHCWAVKIGVDGEAVLASAILRVYSKSREAGSASKVFEEIDDKNVASCNAYVSALLRMGRSFEAVALFKDMMEVFYRSPDSDNLVSVITVGTRVSSVALGRQAHGLAVKLGLALEIMVGTSLVHMYSKHGLSRQAYRVFEEMRFARNSATWNAIISGMMSNSRIETALALFGAMIAEEVEPDFAIWNSIISGFLQLGKGVEACEWFRRMQTTVGVLTPDLKSMTSTLSACSDLLALRSGKEIHGRSIRIHVDGDVTVATALIEMYMNCGVSCCAINVFKGYRMKPKDQAMWNAMISGFRSNRNYESAFKIFDQMLRRKVKPNDATLTSVLVTCSHAGWVDRGLDIFRSMETKFGLRPKKGHYSCMVDLLARCGRVNDALKLVQELPKPPKSVFTSLLSACRTNLDCDLGEEMVKKLVEIDPKNPMPYGILSNIYAELGRWRDVARITAIMDLIESDNVPAFNIIEEIE